MRNRGGRLDRIDWAELYARLGTTTAVAAEVGCSQSAAAKRIQQVVGPQYSRNLLTDEEWLALFNESETITQAARKADTTYNIARYAYQRVMPRVRRQVRLACFVCGGLLADHRIGQCRGDAADRVRRGRPDSTVPGGRISLQMAD